MEKQTRITQAHANVRRSKYALGIGAAVAFLGLGFAARVAHPGGAVKQQASPSSSQDSEAQQSDDSFFFDDGSGSTISPSQSSSPSVQSMGS